MKNESEDEQKKATAQRFHGHCFRARKLTAERFSVSIELRARTAGGKVMLQV
jgi:hypothetical protein